MTFQFADTLIAGLGQPTKAFPSAKTLRRKTEVLSPTRNLQKRMRTATRFVLDDDFTRYAMEASMKASGQDMLNHYDQFRLPADNVWIEWDEHCRCEEMKKLTDEMGIGMSKLVPSDLADNVGYLFHESNLNTGYEQESVLAHCAMDVDGSLSLAPLALQFALLSKTSGYTLRNHKKFVESFSGSPATVIDAQLSRAEEISCTRDGLGSWWCAREEADYSQELSTLYNHIRLVQGQGMALYPPYHSPYTDEGMKKMSDWGLEMTRGDSRFLITVMALLNYDWIIKTPREGNGTRYRFGKYHKGNAHIEVSLDLPKWRGVTITPKGFNEMAESNRRQHSVRGHFRKYRDGRRTWIKAHVRGDAKLGIITKDYRLTHKNREAQLN